MAGRLNETVHDVYPFGSTTHTNFLAYTRQKSFATNGETLLFIEYMAESEGFEPSRRFHAYTISSRAPSAARTTLRVDQFKQSV